MSGDLSIRVPSNNAFSNVGSPSPVLNGASNAEIAALSANNRSYYNSRKGFINRYISNSKKGPFPATLKNAMAAARKANAKEKAYLNAQNALRKESENLQAELKNTMMRGKDFNVYDTIPITFKGDGLGYTAGFGYNFKKKSHYANFVSGFPLKYYRVYGECCDNITKKVNRLRQDIADTAKAIKNEKERRNQEQRNLKAKLAQEKAAARAEANAAKKSYEAKLQQEKNAALSMMEAKRLTSRARVNVSVSKEALNLAQAREFDLLKRDVATRLKNPDDPIYGAYSRAGLRSYNELPEDFKEYIYAKLRRSPSYANRVRKTARLPLSVLRQYNKARYALGFGRTNRNKTLRATKGYTLGAPAFQKGMKNATAKNTRGFFGRLFGRKPAPSTTLGNAYAAMNKGGAGSSPVASLGNAYSAL